MSVTIERGLVKTSYGYIHYRVAGQGTPIALLHVNQQSSALYHEMIEALAPTMRAVAIDYPSHGCSDHIDYQPKIEDYAKCVVEVMDALGIDRFAVMGEAAGTGVAVALANGWRDRVIKVVLINCPVIVEPPDVFLAPFKNTFRPSDPTGFPALRTIEWMLKTDPEHTPMNPTQSWMDRVNRAQMECGRDRWQVLTALAHFDMIGGLKAVTQPVTLFISEFFYFNERVPMILEAVKDIRSETIKGARICAHWEFAKPIAEKTIAFVGAAK